MQYCKPETEIKVVLYSKWSWNVLDIVVKLGKGAIWRVDDLIRQYSEAQVSCPVTYCYSSGDVRRLMKDYRIVDLRKDHIFPYKVDKYIQYSYEHVWYFRWMLRSLFRSLERHLGSHSLVVAQAEEPIRKESTV